MCDRQTIRKLKEVISLEVLPRTQLGTFHILAMKYQRRWVTRCGLIAGGTTKPFECLTTSISVFRSLRKCWGHLTILISWLRRDDTFLLHNLPYILFYKYVLESTKKLACHRRPEFTNKWRQPPTCCETISPQQARPVKTGGNSEKCNTVKLNKRSVKSSNTCMPALRLHNWRIWRSQFPRTPSQEIK